MTTVEELAIAVIKACEIENVEHMLTGAFAFNFYGLPRATKDVDIVVDVSLSKSITKLIERLEPEIKFGDQVQFDTLTWGRRHIGTPAADTTLQIELFELFDDDFVQSQFQRRKKLLLPQINLSTWIPTPEDIVVQKLRWARPKDLDDAKDILAIEGTDTLDMTYIEKWCTLHSTMQRLKDTLAKIPLF